jgi:hypothetical protein
VFLLVFFAVIIMMVMVMMRLMVIAIVIYIRACSFGASHCLFYLIIYSIKHRLEAVLVIDVGMTVVLADGAVVVVVVVVEMG